MTTHTLPTVAAGARATKSLAICTRLLALAGLEEMLDGEGPYTLFAPTDRAFADLPPGTLAALENDPARLRATLGYHLLCVRHELSEIRNGKLPTLEGTLLTALVTDDGLRLDHTSVSNQPLRCANGVIHQIGAVLFPGFTPPMSLAAQGETPWTGRRRALRAAPTTAAQAAEAFFDSPPSPPAIPSAS